MLQLLHTPFHERTSKLCTPQNWRRWAGYLVAGSYELSLDREYWAIRNSAALIDVSPLMKYLITGKDAARLLNRVVTRDIDKLQVGQVYYTGWCDEDGKMIDDGTVSRLDEATYRLTSLVSLRGGCKPTWQSLVLWLLEIATTLRASQCHK